MYFIREENVQDGGNKLFTVDQIKLFSDSNEKMGYIKLTYIPSSIDFNLFIFLGLKGHCGLPENEEELYLITDPEKRHRVTHTMANLCRFGYHRSNELADESKSVTDYREFIKQTGIVETLHERFGAEHQMYIDFFVDKPFVDFIRVHDKFQGNCFGYRLYLEAAKWMAEKNMQARLSGIICHQAVNVIRQKLMDRGLIVTGKAVWYNGEQEYLYLKAPEGTAA